MGPTLGAAAMMAAEGRSLGGVALTMLLFGIGAALPLILFGAIAREAMTRWRGRLLATGEGAKAALGIALVLVGLGIVSGLDRTIETRLVRASPPWLTALTAQF